MSFAVMATATHTVFEGPLTWQDVLDHPALRDLPFKIELNERGQIVMSPATNQHGIYQSKLSRLLYEQLGGETVTECSIDTPKGTKVADVAWLSEAFLEEHGAETPYRHAPDLCVEVLSPSNAADEMQEKIMLYLAKGAREVWICDLEGHVTFHGHDGERDRSALAPDFPRRV